MRLKRILIYLLIFSIINPLPFLDTFIGPTVIAQSKPKPKSKSTSKSKSKPKPKSKSKTKTGKSKKSTKKSKKSKRGRGRTYSAPVSRNPVFDVISTDTLSPGLYYKKLRIGSTKYPPVTVHVLEGDLNNPDIKLEILKANGNSTGLEKLHNIITDYNTRHEGYEVKGAVNGSYWMAYYNYPIGTTVIDGDVVELDDKWYTGLFDDKGQLYIEPFKTKASIKVGRNKFDIEHVNRRTDSEGIVLYNHFGGNKIPYFINKSAEEVMAEIAEENRIDKQLIDTTFSEFTEGVDEEDEEIDTLEFQSELHKLERNSYLEMHSIKYVMKRLEDAAINKDIPCVVVSVDSGVVAMPEGGFVLTPGSNSGIKLHKGDTAVVRFATDIMPGSTFANGVAGTPRLVDDGVAAKIAGPKYYRYSKKSKKKKKKGKKSTKGKKKGKKGKKRKKGKRGRRGRYLRSSRFYHSFLPRTALGVTEDRKTVFLVSVPASNLDYMTYIMKILGSYTAVNLDGGGSTVMVIDDKNVVGRPDYSRKISIGVGFSVKKDGNHSGSEKREMIR
jgi:hypothetical protein